VSPYADEVLIAVDADSTDDTYAVACRYADRVRAVEIGGNRALARDWLHHQAGGDWVLMLDDDEMLPPDAAAPLGELLGDRHLTHYFLPVRRVVERGGYKGWVPDPAVGRRGSVRLWRQLGGLHFFDAADSAGPVVLGHGRALPEGDPLPVYSWGHLWSEGPAESSSSADPLPFDMAFTPGRPSVRTYRPQPDQITSRAELAAFVDSRNPSTSPWSADYRLVDAPAEVTANRGALLRIAITNTSRALWAAVGHQDQRIVLGNRWSTPEFGDEVPMGDTTLLPHPIPPGEEVELQAGVWTPRIPGRYHLTVELMREGDAWFSQHGVTPMTLDVTVMAGDAPMSARHYGGRLQDDPDGDPSTPVPSWVVPLPPVRALDTRGGSGVADAVKGPLDQDRLFVLRLAGVAGVPPEACGVVATVTVLDADYHGWLAGFGTDGTVGEAFPVLHFFDDGRPVTATMIAALGVGRGNGKLSFHLAPGPTRCTAQVIVDLRGYLLPVVAGEMGALPATR
jgi:hypothetical protein